MFLQAPGVFQACLVPTTLDRGSGQNKQTTIVPHQVELRVNEKREVRLRCFYKLQAWGPPRRELECCHFKSIASREPGKTQHYTGLPRLFGRRVEEGQVVRLRVCRSNAPFNCESSPPKNHTERSRQS